MSSLFDYSKVRAQNASTKTIRDTIDDVLSENDNACYTEMEPRLLSPGIAGSRYFDQHAAVGILLDHDKKHGGHIHTMMVEQRISERLLWDFLYKVLHDYYPLRVGRAQRVLG